jgi:hypothetical protein
LRRRVHAVVGLDGDAIVEFMAAVMTDARERTRDRLEAAKWLADRGFGKAPLGEVAPSTDYPMLDLSKLTDDELDTLIALHEKARPQHV